MDIAHYLHPHPPRSATLTSLPLPLHRTALLSSSSSSSSSSFPLSITSPASPSIAATPKPFPLPELDHPDFLAIDDLLDFCNDEIGGPTEAPISFSTTPSPSSTAPTTSPTSTAPAPAPAPPPLQSFPEPPVSSEKKQQVLSVFDSDEICVPCDELAELEWLSNFVEESFSSVDTTQPPASTVPALEGPRVVTTSKVEMGEAEQEEQEDEEEEEEEEEKTSRGTFHSTSPVSVLEGSLIPRERATSFSPETSIPARARTKRCRAAVCFWNSRILSAEASESILETSSTTSTITTDNDMFAATYYDEDSDDDDDDEEEEEEIIDRDHINENAAINDDDDDDEHINKNHLPSHPQSKRFEKNGSGKVKKSGMNNTASTNKSKRVKVLDGASVRKCLHCASQKTPQWRAGPLGPKTLCNACGVRYKSGRLCAEYRPASSPTFNETEHSNSHRRVLEMRRQRGEPVINSSNVSVVSHRHEKLSNRDSYVEDQGRLYVAKH